MKSLNEVKLTKLTQVEVKAVKGGNEISGGSRLNENDSVSFEVQSNAVNVSKI